MLRFQAQPLLKHEKNIPRQRHSKYLPLEHLISIHFIHKISVANTLSLSTSLNLTLPREMLGDLAPEWLPYSNVGVQAKLTIYGPVMSTWER